MGKGVGDMGKGVGDVTLGMGVGSDLEFLSAKVVLQTLI